MGTYVGARVLSPTVPTTEVFYRDFFLSAGPLRTAEPDVDGLVAIRRQLDFKLLREVTRTAARHPVLEFLDLHRCRDALALDFLAAERLEHLEHVGVLDAARNG